ncbi:MAG TPA: hypothetical protein VFU76_15325 [Terriglobales bacterium]|nr:hypothetical protein [Terriglobales bacterium]
MRNLLRIVILALLSCALVGAAFAQEEPEEKPKTISVSPRVRLQAARTMYLKNLGGDDIPFTLATNAMTGWRYIVVDDPGKADLIMEISAPDDPDKDKDKDKGDTGVRAGYNGRNIVGGNQPQSTRSSGVPTSDVKMVVRDSHTRAVLWAGTEQAKEAFRRNKQDENLESAAQKLIQRFEKAVDPETAKQE